MKLTEARKQLAKKINLKRMTRNNARVAIAKDVIASLKAKRFFATRGTYLTANKDLSKRVRDRLARQMPVELREVLPTLKCDVCAIGSVFCAVVQRVNDFPLDPRRLEDGARPYVNDESMIEKLEPYFDSQELREMESFFEYRYTDLHSADEVLNALMNHIVKSKGEFDAVRFQNECGLTRTRL